MKRWLPLLVLLMGSMACEGRVDLFADRLDGPGLPGLPGNDGDDNNGAGDDGDDNNGGPGGDNNGVDPFDPIAPDCEGIACDPALPTVTPRLTRLTHEQWENSVRDLLRLDARTDLSVSFLGDTLSVGKFDNLAEALEVTGGLWEDYREAAEVLAAQVAADPAALAALEPANPPDDSTERARAFVEHFGRRAYRRPLTDAEIDRHLELYAQSGELFGGAPSHASGVELLLRVFLQSPFFLYRVELQHEADAEFVALSGYERAARLSYALWNSMPDDALLAAADAGELDDAVSAETHVLRMLDDPRAEAMVGDFHGQMLQFDHFDDMDKNAERFPEFHPELPEMMKRELELFVRDLVLERDGTIAELFTDRRTFVNADLAAIYELTGSFGDDFEVAELDGTTRSGLLTRVGFLAVNATAYDPNSIHRGVFVNHHVTCTPLPPPPDNFTIPDGVTGDTNRERIHNATAECGGACHTVLINPPGFAFETYDAIGRYRDTENGFAVDASGEYPLDGNNLAFTDAVDFSQKLAASPQTHTCYTAHWFEYLHGRLIEAGDKPLIARLSQASIAGELTIKQLIARLVLNDVFLTRKASTTGATP